MLKICTILFFITLRPLLPTTSPIIKNFFLIVFLKTLFQCHCFEDFVLYHKSGLPFLTTIFHEEIAFLDVDETTIKQIFKQIPIFQELLIEQEKCKQRYAVSVKYDNDTTYLPPVKIIKIFDSETDNWKKNTSLFDDTL